MGGQRRRCEPRAECRCEVGGGNRSDGTAYLKSHCRGLHREGADEAVRDQDGEGATWHSQDGREPGDERRPITMSKDSVMLGVDIGGTKIAVGLVDNSGKILAHDGNPIMPNGPPEGGRHAVFGAIDSLITTRPFRGMGI